MIDSFVLLTPILMLGVIALVRFVGCQWVYGVSEPEAFVDPPINLQATSRDQSVDLTWDYAKEAISFDVWFHVDMLGDYEIFQNPNIVVVTMQGAQHASASLSNLTNGTKYFFKVIAHTAAGDSSLDASLEVFATPGVTPFVTLLTAGGLRNTFSGWVGMAVQMNADAIVTQLGRLVVANNITTHDLRIVDPAQSNAALGTVTLSMPAGPIGEFAYQPLPQPVALKAFHLYYFLTHEDNGGDNFHDIAGMVVNTTSIGTILSGVFSDDATPDTFMFVGSQNQLYGPVNFRY